MPLLPTEKDFFSIGEAAQVAEVEPYVLRYWEREFGLLRPVRRESGHRKYSRKDIESILKIKELLYLRGFTIVGAKKHLAQEHRAKPEQIKMALEDNSAAVELLRETKNVLEDLVKSLRS